jgi:hypothetical protein
VGLPGLVESIQPVAKALLHPQCQIMTLRCHELDALGTPAVVAALQLPWCSLRSLRFKEAADVAALLDALESKHCQLAHIECEQDDLQQHPAVVRNARKNARRLALDLLNETPMSKVVLGFVLEYMLDDEHQFFGHTPEVAMQNVTQVLHETKSINNVFP